MPAAHTTTTTPHTHRCYLVQDLSRCMAQRCTRQHSTAQSADNTCPLTNHANRHTTSRSAPQEGWAHTHATTIRQHTGKPPYSQDQHHNLYCVE
jgi:hypothetical protein